MGGGGGFKNTKGGACFVAGTLILAKTGNIPIESIEVGDYVYSENTLTGEKAESGDRGYE